MMDIPENKYEMMDALKGMHIGKHDDFYSTDFVYRIILHIDGSMETGEKIHISYDPPTLQ